jgi:nitrous oxidase accessory protein NosD
MSSPSYNDYVRASTIKRTLIRAASKSSFLSLVMLTSALLLPRQAWTATHYVDAAAAASPPGTGCGASAGYKTIGAAIAVASPGDTIRVCPGLYAEQVNINKTLTLLGAQAGIDARTRPFVAANESIIDHPCGPVQITADNVVLDGFTIQGSTLPDPCFLAGIWTNPGFSGTKGGHQILNNIVRNNISGIELDSTCDANPTLVEHNLIQNNNNPGPGSGNGIQVNFGLCKATINANKFSGHTSSSILVVAASDFLMVSSNELVGGTAEGIAFLLVSNSTIKGNVSVGSTSFGTIDLFGGNSNIAVDGNVLHNGVRGILVENPFASLGVDPNSDVTAHQNCIVGNSIAGLEASAGGHSGTLNAENNWWGSSTGPTNPNNPGGTGDKVIDPDGVVDFTPWLTSSTGGACPVPSTPGKVTGGGQITGTDPMFSPLGDLLSVPALIPSMANPNAKATFGFVVQCCPTTGNLDYNDHQAGVRIKALSIDKLVIGSGDCGADTHATFTGTASVIRSVATTTEPFTVEVDDCGEPGTADKFRIKTTTYSNGPSTLIGGNIEIHR